LADTDEILIRGVLPEDLPALRRIFLESRRATFTWINQSKLALEDFDKASAGETVLVALSGGRPVGLVSWWPPENFVHSLFIAPGHERRGIGGRLLREALSRMGRPARLKVDVPNEQAIAFYAAQGWKIVDRGSGEFGDYFVMQLG
jgi:ribosomal protein S18 acetylase RimI-like enzyme